MKLWKKLTAAVLMSAAMLGAGLTAKPLFPALAGAEITAQAEDEIITIGDLAFTKKDTYVVLKKCSQSVTKVEIPDAIDGLPVKGIGQQAFHSCTGLSNLTIPDSVKSIGKDAFFGCNGLKSITIPDSVVSIGKYALSNCTGLTNVRIPNRLTTIEDGTFYSCSGLTSIVIPDSVKSIGEFAFYHCTKLIRAEIGKNVTSIGGSAFSGCTRMTDLLLPDKITSIGGAAFSACDRLTDIQIPDSVTSIGKASFANCKGLQSAVISGSAAEIGIRAFSGCDALTNVTIREGVTSIGDHAFVNCKGLTTVTFPDSMTIIGHHAFFNCSKLAGITIPDGVTSIEKEAFAYCSKLTGVIFGNSVKSIGANAFAGCYSLTNMKINSSVTSLGGSAFSGCKSLTSVAIPDSVTGSVSGTFSNCSGLISVTIGERVTAISGNAFLNCTGLKNVTIPDSVTNIGDNVFSGCSGYVIHGNAGSYAEQYALENGVPFCELGKKGIDTVVLSRESFSYTGKQVKIGSYITVKSGGRKLRYGTDFTLSYKDNLNTGTASVIIRGMGNYGGSETKSYQITPAEIDSASLQRDKYCYSGEEVQVGMFLCVRSGSLELKYPADFLLGYSNNIKCGMNTAFVTVVGKGNFTGTVTLYYSIGPALSTKKGRLHIEWSSVEGADGYQVQYCQDPSFTGDTVHTASVTKLYCDLATYPKAGETWYVRVRSFTTTSSGGKNYGAWSGASSITLATIDNVSLKYTAFHYKDGAPVKVGKYLTVYSGDNTKLKYGKDFTLVYKNNVKRGTASVTIKGIGEYAGSSVTKTYRIV